MINSIDEFARIWGKDSKALSQLDYFSFLLIQELSPLLNEVWAEKSIPVSFRLNEEQISELVVQLADGLQFFYDRICFGKGCALGCPNKLDKPFSKREDEERLEIINREFDGHYEACASREDCLRHDLMNYVVKDVLLDYYIFFRHIKPTEDNPHINEMAATIVDFIIGYTTKNGSTLLQDPDQKLKDIKSAGL